MKLGPMTILDLMLISDPVDSFRNLYCLGSHNISKKTLKSSRHKFSTNQIIFEKEETTLTSNDATDEEIIIVYSIHFSLLKLAYSAR